MTENAKALDVALAEAKSGKTTFEADVHKAMDP